MIGTKLGSYEITAKLGEGGMGEVYRARDTKLEREVAIKVLPASVAGDPERLARFEREAKLLAQLHHPNIASIFGLEESGEAPALVLELVEGPTLAERLADGPLPLEEALPIAQQIAEGLEFAHEHGVIHRDLKPANVKLAGDARVKILDFGLAKAMEPVGGAASAGDLARSPTLLNSPTLTAAGTQLGVILGTAAYMAPEQARGLAVDRRADIWAFGVVVYEMLTGASLFASETVTDTLAGVLKTEIDLAALPAATPPALRRLLRRCLERAPRSRLRDIGDAKLELSEAESGPAEVAAPVAIAGTGRRGWFWPVLAATALVVGFGVARLLAPGSAAATAPVRARLTLALPTDAPLAAGNFLPSLAFSPDGASLAYVAVGADGVRRLAVRRLDAPDVKVIPGTEGAEGPFFSPDGQWIGFWSKWKIRKVRASGVGLPETICGSLDFRGGTWAGHEIVFAPSQFGPLYRVDDRGGTPRPLTELLPSEENQRLPHALPGGRTILFTAWKSPFDADRSTLWALSLDTGKRKEIGATSHDVVYSPAGYLLYVQAGRLLAEPFDRGRLEITGPATTILDHVVVQKNTGAAQFDVSSTGALAWAAGDAVGGHVRLLRVDRAGKSTAFFSTNTVRRYPRLSPDDRSLLVMAIGPEVQGDWLMSVDGSAERRMGREVNNPLWLPDGRWVSTDLSNALSVQSPDGSSPIRQLVAPQPNPVLITGASPDGTLAYDTVSPKDGLDSWLVDEKGGKAIRFLTGPANAGGVTFSPDARYVAYVSDESGDFQVYVTSYPNRAATWQLSTAGGSEPLWRRDGKEIVYRSGNELVAVPVTTTPTFHAGIPAVLFPRPYDGLLGSPDVPNFDASRDGSWFVMTDSPDLNQPSASIEIAFDWPAVLDGT